MRWTVESYHGRVKKWNFFLERRGNQRIPKLQDCMRIALATLNKYRDLSLKGINNAENQNLGSSIQHRLMESKKLLEKI